MALTKTQKKTLITNLIRSHYWDDTFARRIVSGRLVGFYHPAGGHLAPGIAAASFLRDEDCLSPHHRAHGMAHMLSKGIDLKYYLAEHTSKEIGCCKGRSAYHFCFPDKGVYLMAGFIGYNHTVSVGYGWSAKRAGDGRVVMNCSGDGSYNNGRVHEAMLMANNWKLPIIFMCENNGLAIYAEIEEMHPTENIASLAKGYDMPSAIVDGQDVFECAEAVAKAVKRARDGKGPTLIEAKTQRWREHDIGTPDLAGHKPRTKKEIAELKKRDPLRIATEHVLERKVLTQGEIDAIHEEAIAEIAAAEEFADNSPLVEHTVEELEQMIFAP